MSTSARPLALLLRHGHKIMPWSQEARKTPNEGHNPTRFKFRYLQQNEKRLRILGLPKDIGWELIRVGKRMMFHSSDPRAQGQTLGRPVSWEPEVVLYHVLVMCSHRDHRPLPEAEGCIGSKVSVSEWPRAERLKSHAWKEQRKSRRIEAPLSNWTRLR